MKNLLIVHLFLSSLVASAQNYDLFNINTKKLFADYPTPYRTYSLSIDSVITQGNETFYYTFFTVDSIDFNYQSDTCWFWPGQNCKQQYDPSWLGYIVEQNNSLGNYIFPNRNYDSLNFNFQILVGDTSLFFQNAAEKFSIVRLNDDTITSIGLFDSAHIYKIIHTDLSGNIINSTLNNQQIVIGKDYGLMQFLRVDSFPNILQPVSMIGSINPNAGLNAITSEMIYDYQPGDEIQFDEYFWYYPSPPWLVANQYRKYVFLSKAANPDSIFYTVQQTVFNDTSLQSVVDTVLIKYYRFDTIATLPFERFNGSFKNLYYENYCGINMLTFHSYNPNYYGYCQVDNCYGPIDVFGDPYVYENIWVTGIGHKYYDKERMLMGTLYFEETKNEIIYFKKNGIPCGNEVYVGLNEIENDASTIQIYPNPASDYFEIKSSIRIKSFSIFDLTGREIFSDNKFSNGDRINTSGFENGIYNLKLESSSGNIFTKKIIVSH